MNLFVELRRRNVIRVAGLYLVGAWLVVQIAETLLPIFHTPDWVLQALVVLLALGFVPALVFAWVFEMTPQGLRRESEIERTASTVDHTARKLDIAVIVLLVAVAAMMIWNRSSPETGPGVADSPEQSGAEAIDTEITTPDPVSAPLRSIAVLAFDDLSAEQDQAYFAEGVSEELLNVLARIDGLQVAARTSSFKFKDGDSDIGEIGRALGVDAVLEGSVRKSGDQLRITAQLIKTSDGFHLWSESYDRKIENIFAVQDEIATAIVDALKLELDLAQETAGRTANVAAYDLYLRGRQEGRQPSREGLLRAIDLYEQALAVDEGFAAAHGGIAEAWIWLEDYGGFRSTEAYPRAEVAARRALALDPQSAEANAAMAMVQDRFYNDAQESARFFERTLEINPNYVVAYNMYADALQDLGQPLRAIEMQQRSVELDPLSVFFRARLAGRLVANGQLERAEVLIAEILRDAPGNDYALEEQAALRLGQGRLADAAELYRTVHEARPGDPFSAAWLAIIGSVVEDDAMAQAWIAAARSRGADNRWELMAREAVAEWRGDWVALDAVGSARGGDRGAYLRGLAAIGQQRWPEARQALSDALRLSGYREGEPIESGSVPALIMMAWLEKREGQEAASVRLAAVEAHLERINADGGLAVNGMSSQVQAARAAAVAGDRERSLAHLRTVFERRGHLQSWFLERDPVFGPWREDPGFKALVTEMRALAEAEHARIVEAGLQRPAP
jgi:TolB-like protein/Tfp pilus assembly protein PilF